MGSILHLFLNLPGRKTPIHCKAKVRRVEEVKKNKTYEIGVSITQIRKSEKNALKRLIRMSVGKKQNSPA